MQRSVNMARAWLFGLVWGIVFSGGWTVADLQHLKMAHDGYTWEDHLTGYLYQWFYFSAFGLLFSIPYAVTLDICEKFRVDKPPNFLWRSVLVSALWSLLFLLCYVFFTDVDYAPGWFSGPWRVGLAGCAAALVGGYIVGRELSPYPVNRAIILYDRFALVIWVGYVVSAWIVFSSIFFPVMAKAS